MTIMYHGAHTAFSPHTGLCLTDDSDIASTYASEGVIAVLVIDLDGLTVADVAGYDHDSDTAPGDDGIADTDVIVYDDADKYGTSHRTWRLMSDAAVARLVVVAVVPADWWAASSDVADDDRLAWIAAWRNAGAEVDDVDLYGTVEEFEIS